MARRAKLGKGLLSDFYLLTKDQNTDFLIPGLDLGHVASRESVQQILLGWRGLSSRYPS